MDNKNNIITFPQQRCRPADADTMIIVQSIFPDPRNVKEFDSAIDLVKASYPQRFNPDF